MFFISDRRKLRLEGDPKDAILYYHPTLVSVRTIFIGCPTLISPQVYYWW